MIDTMWGRLAWLLAGMLGACTYDPIAAGQVIDAPTNPDAVDAVDAPVTNDAQGCFGTYLQVCLPLPTAPITATTPIDTDTAVCENTGATAAGLCVIAGTTIDIPSGTALRATGSKPLVLLATAGAITIDGTLDVSSGVGGQAGAGRGTGSCDPGGTPSLGAGGQGGTFGGDGGDGGAGLSGSTKGTKGAKTALPAGELRGGCDGAAGAGGSPGSGGAGGGAVLLIASGAITITVTGLVNASGASGDGAGGTSSGGGGGGSGGTIVFDATAVSVSGIVFSNGGAGGEGSSNIAGATGNPGIDATPPAPAIGGSGGTIRGGDGGDGSNGANAANASDGNSDGGGGGGGGGSGFVRSTPLPTNSGTISPPASAPP